MEQTMNLKSMFLLTVVLLPTLVAFRLDYGEGEYAICNFEEVKNPKELQGAQGFVRLAIVLFATKDCIFQQGTRVALKIGYIGEEESLQRDQEAHNFIRKNDPKGEIDGVVQAEKFLGVSRDLHKDKHWLLPEQKQDEYLVLVMEAIGKDLHSLVTSGVQFSEEDLLKFHEQLGATFKKLRAIGFSHGDPKLDNILLKKGSDPKSGVVLIDLGLSVYDGALSIRTCAGTPVFISPTQHILYRAATCGDSEVGGTYSLSYLATQYLPWIAVYNDSKKKEFEQKYDLHVERMLVAKYEFYFHPFAKCPQAQRRSEGFEKAIAAMLGTAMSGEVKEDLETVENTIAYYKTQILVSSKNG